MEYGYSCMGYEIAGGLGVKMAAPEREVFVLVGDGSYLMMAQEIVTAVQEGIKLIIVLLDNHGFASIGGLSESVGSGGFGTRYRERNPATGELDGDALPVDLAANAAVARRAGLAREHDRRVPRRARRPRRGAPGVVVIVIPVDRESRVGGYDSWWDVPVAEVSSSRDGAGRARGLRRRAAQGARLSVIRVANAPCSWGALEFEADRAARARVAGPRRNGRRRLRRHRARRLGVPADRYRRRWRRTSAAASWRSSRRSCRSRSRARTRSTRAWRARTVRHRMTRAVLVRCVARAVGAPLLVLADDNASVPNRTDARGPHPREDGLSAAEWDAFARRAERVAAAVRDATGLRTVFHHHCGGYVETPRGDRRAAVAHRSARCSGCASTPVT